MNKKFVLIISTFIILGIFFNPVPYGYSPMGTITVQPTPSNQSSGVQIYPLLYAIVNNSDGDSFNITWMTNATEYGGSWTIINTNNSVTNGTYTFRPLFNQSVTNYYWRICVLEDGTWTNKTYNFTTQSYQWSTWSPAWHFTFSNDEPTNFTSLAYNETVINLTWTTGNQGADSTVIVRNATGNESYPTPSNGTIIYNGTLEYYNDSQLTLGTRYYYTAWSWNETYQNFSVDYAQTSDVTLGGLGIWDEFPVNTSTSVTRPPGNFSAHINGSTHIYFYYVNHTPVNPTWTLINNWSGTLTDGYYSVNVSTGYGVSFIWGNTTYTWSINITNDGGEWLNKTFTYTTYATVTSGANARYDITNDGASINALDLSFDWAHRTVGGYATYNGYYDVNNDDAVNAIDLSFIWSEV